MGFRALAFGELAFVAKTVAHQKVGLECWVAFFCLRSAANHGAKGGDLELGCKVEGLGCRAVRFRFSVEGLSI